MCTALYMMVLYDQARVGPTTKTSDEISIICLFRLILQANPFFCFVLWYSSCFEVKCWFHTFSKWCSHTFMWILILLDHRVCHVNPFNQRVSLQVDPITSIVARSITSPSERCLFHPSPSCLCFPSLSPFSSRNQISYSRIILMLWSLFIPFSVYVFIRWFSEDANEAASSSLITHFLLRWI